MEIDYWASRWKDGRTGWHEGRANRFLATHIERLGQATRVLVPLCGKTEDMAFLAARGHEVVGIEAVEAAARAFFAEHGVTPKVHDLRSGVRSLSSGRVTIIVSDVFACTKADVGAMGGLYDRAALVALPPDVRRRYVPHLRAMLETPASALVVTFDYRQEAFQPPPFAVSEAEVRELYAGAHVEAIDEVPAEGRFREAGVDATERCFAITM
jgi:thiopurine S-methyltransferase